MAFDRLPGGFGALMWQSFLRTYGPVVAVLSFLATIAAWFIGRGASVSIVWLVPLVSVMLIVTVALLQASLFAFRAAGRQLPTVRRASKSPAAYRDIAAILLLEHSELFAPDALISVYQVRDQDYEVLLGVGRVLTVQENGLIQVGITNVIEPETGFMERLISNDLTVLRTLVVKPTIPRYVLQRMGVDQ